MAYSHAQVAHVWAQQEKERGNGSNMFFEGKTIYSYGYHFPLATFLSNGAVVINNESYSVSTAKHQSHVFRAVGYNYLSTVDEKQLQCIIKLESSTKERAKALKKELKTLITHKLEALYAEKNGKRS